MNSYDFVYFILQYYQDGEIKMNNRSLMEIYSLLGASFFLFFFFIFILKNESNFIQLLFNFTKLVEAEELKS